MHRKELVPLFHSTPMEVYLEKIYLFKYLLEIRESEEKAWEEFKDIICESDLEKKLINNEFRYYLRIGKKKKWIVRPKTSFFITKDEINHINQIKAPKEFREFVLGMIIYGKYTKQQIGLPLFNPRDRSYIYFLMNGVDNFNVGKDRHKYLNQLISKRDIGTNIRYYPASLDLNSRSRVLNVPKTVESFDADWINWEAEEGYEVLDIEKDALVLKEKIVDQSDICTECGKPYKKSNKSQTTLCPECYKWYRKAKNAENNRKYRQNQRNRDQQPPEC